MTGEKIDQAPLPPVCEVSLAAANVMLAPVAAALSDHNSVLYAAYLDRMDRVQGEAKFGIASALVPDPARTGVRVPRHEVQSGRLPDDAAPATIEQAVSLWTLSPEDIPPLRVPPGEGPKVMELAGKMQMFGGGDVVYAREEVGRVKRTPKTWVKIDGAGNNAPRERIETALRFAEVSGYDRPFIATVDSSRQLKEREKERVAAFAPDAENEYDLFVASALSKGFTLDEQRYGVRHLPDGSTYVTMTHGQSGARLIVLAPHRYQGEGGRYRNGVYNGYQVLARHGAGLPGMSGFMLEGADMVVVTGTHYGAMSVVNNLYEGHELRINLSSYRVIGDNQPKTRNEQAHLVEIGYVADAVNRKTALYPALRAALQTTIFA